MLKVDQINEIRWPPSGEHWSMRHNTRHLRLATRTAAVFQARVLTLTRILAETRSIYPPC
jgi:hypothetical protein